MCSGSEEGSYLRLIDFVYHSTLGLGVIKKKQNTIFLNTYSMFGASPLPGLRNVKGLGCRVQGLGCASSTVMSNSPDLYIYIERERVRETEREGGSGI